MQNKPLLLFYPLKVLILTAILISGGCFMLSAQGWERDILTSPGPIDSLFFDLDNSIVNIPAFAEGETYLIGKHPHNTWRPIPGFYHIEGEEYAGKFSAGLASEWADYTSYFPIAGEMLGPDTTFVLIDRNLTFPSNSYSIELARQYRNEDGEQTYLNLDWIKTCYEAEEAKVSGGSMIYSQDNQILILADIGPITEPFPGITRDLLLIKVDLDGNVLWSNILESPGNDEAVQAVLDPDGGYWLLKNVREPFAPYHEATPWLIKVDENGTFEWEQLLSNPPTGQTFDMIQTNDGGLAITGRNLNSQLLVLKVDELGNEIWRQEYDPVEYSSIGRGIIEDHEQNLIVAGNITYPNNEEENAYLVKLTATGTPIWEREFGQSDVSDRFNDITLTPSGDYLMGGYTEEADPWVNDIFRAYIVKTDQMGTIYGGAISGNVFHDTNVNCLADANELKLGDWIIQATNDTYHFYGNTDEQGNYSIPVDVSDGASENYIVSVIPPNPYWETCQNDVAVTIQYQEEVAVDFPMQAIIECPYLETQISSSNIRPCDDAQIFISYCNQGTAIAEEAYVEVTLDENLLFVAASVTPVEVNGTTYTFLLGDVLINDCGTIMIDVVADCNEVGVGDAVCISAAIYPDDICETNDSNWTGALIQTAYTCEEDGAQFSIENTGTAAMASQLDYVIIEDAVLFLQDTFVLPAGGTKVLDPLPLNGFTYTLMAQQEPGAPGPAWVVISAVDCNSPNDPVLNQFPQNTGHPFVSTHCPIIVGSFDPNDKKAIPSGFGQENYVLPDTDLNYTIRFQNTGTDTAFRVVIKDALSNQLDPATIIPGPASHPYEWHFEDRTLVFNFPNIELPDSTTNLEASQGFVSFKISQIRGLPAGTTIENTADIYFDFNAPITTNTSTHTVYEFISIVGTTTVDEPGLAVRIIPNPMQTGAWIKLDRAGSLTNTLTLHLFDALGKKVLDVQATGNNIWLDRNDLPKGLYFFTISETGQPKASGKLVIQ